MVNRRTLMAVAFGLLVSFPAAADYQEGLVAYKRGDFEAAYREMKALADQGHAAAQNDIGFMYYQGQAVAQNHKEAAKWYFRAAKQGYPAAQNNLAFLYENGEGVRYDERRARAWYAKAAEQGHPGAQFNIGLMYQHGRGGALDLVEAFKWLSIAAERLPSGESREAAERKLLMTERRMNDAEIAEAHRRARDWLARFGSESRLPSGHWTG